MIIRTGILPKRICRHYENKSVGKMGSTIVLNIATCSTRYYNCKFSISTILHIEYVPGGVAYCCIVMTSYYSSNHIRQCCSTGIGAAEWFLQCQWRTAGIYSLNEVSKPRDWMLWWLYRSEFSQASRRHCCRGECQISERLEKSETESRNFDTSWDFAARRPST